MNERVDTDALRAKIRLGYGGDSEVMVPTTDLVALCAQYDATVPKPPTLREKVAEAIDAATLAREPHGYVMETVERNDITDAVLAVIADEAGPLWGHDVAAWLRGEQP